jgi:hypothetical protein
MSPHVLDQEVVLDDGARDANGVALLEGIQANGGRGHLAGDDHHRNAVHVGRGNAGDRIGDARAGGDQRHTDVARGARIAVGRMHGRLFVAHQHVLDGVLLVESVVDVQDGTAGVAPDVLDVSACRALTRISAPRSSGVLRWTDVLTADVAAAAEAISAFEISMINLCEFL